MLAMIAFASNSLLCRAALKQTAVDPATFTFIRIFSGAAALWLIMQIPRGIIAPSPQSPPKGRGGFFSLREKIRMRDAGNWISAFALFIYAVAFSFAYVDLSAGTGALLLFGAVQATMILWSLYKGERLDVIQIAGFVVAVTGLVVLLFPGLSAPPLIGSILMLTAGAAWGIYSLRGKVENNPVSATTGNFVRAALFAAAVSIIFIPRVHLDPAGVIYAVISGAITSGLGYVIWYSALPRLKAASAAAVQLSVPILAATGGIVLLGEPITFRYVIASIAILGGIALVVIEKNHSGKPNDMISSPAQ
jgi:drug/metabolite transporter (DMT)-like permease